jgi:POT family proton-dependent oligopeptide transporter
VDLAGRLDRLTSGFSKAFWIANTLELFERFAYYASKAVLAVYIADGIGLGPVTAGIFAGSVFNTLLYLLPPLAGTVVDRFGFRRSLMACFAIFSAGYFLIGLAGLPAGAPLVAALGGPKAYTLLALVVTAVGGSLIKPCVVGTVARTTSEGTKALGYSIYYTLVNIGGAVGPILAIPVRENVGIAWVLVMSSATTFLLFVSTILFFAEPPRPPDAAAPKSMAGVLADMLRVFGNARFMTFLVIFSGFWAMFWQVFYSLPFYVRDVLKFPRFELIETVDAWAIILVTIPITALARKLRPIRAMTVGFLLASFCWLVMASSPTLPVTIAGIVLFALGEGLQSPRYYEYVANLAPKEQIGTYMGFAFLPIAIGTFVAGIIAGPLAARFELCKTEAVVHPERLWLWVGGIGFASTVLMLLYDRFLAPKEGAD